GARGLADGDGRWRTPRDDQIFPKREHLGRWPDVHDVRGARDDVRDIEEQVIPQEEPVFDQTSLERFEAVRARIRIGNVTDFKRVNCLPIASPGDGIRSGIEERTDRLRPAPTWRYQRANDQGHSEQETTTESQIRGVLLIEREALSSRNTFPDQASATGCNSAPPAGATRSAPRRSAPAPDE